MIVYESEQGTREWLQDRAGVITASNFELARSRYKRGEKEGSLTEAARNYAFRLALERIAGSALNESTFMPAEARRGQELEGEARMMHEFVTGLTVEPVGLVTTDDRKFGASADGFIDAPAHGGAEYKCFVDPSKLREILLENDRSSVRDQVQGGMWVTGRRWWHFVLYCPALAVVGLDTMVFEEERDDDYIEAMERDLLTFDRVVEAYRHQLQGHEGVQRLRYHGPAGEEAPPWEEPPAVNYEELQF